MIKMKKRDLIIGYSIFALVIGGLLAGFASCENAASDSADIKSKDSTFDPGGLEGGPGDGNPPIPYGRILKLTTTGENDAVVTGTDKTTDPPASTDWPNMRGREVEGATREVERWQFVIEWRREGKRSDAYIEAALVNLYGVWETWKNKFDPLPYFSYIQDGVDPVTHEITNNQIYVGPNIDYSTGSNEIGTGDPIKLNQSDSLRINFVRYWPPASKVPAGLTKYLSYESWEKQKAISLAPRIAAYTNVKRDIEALIDDIEGSPFYSIPITVDDVEFPALQRIRNNLRELMREAGGSGLPTPTGNISKFNSSRESGKMIITLDEALSGRLYEAYFGFVPDGNGYSHNKYTYPLE
jgi:hypothetical protein